jgi:hypothetical protein
LYIKPPIALPYGLSLHWNWSAILKQRHNLKPLVSGGIAVAASGSWQQAEEELMLEY